MKSIKCRYLNNAELTDRKKTFFLERWTAKIIHVFTMHVHFSGQCNVQFNGGALLKQHNSVSN